MRWILKYEFQNMERWYWQYFETYIVRSVLNQPVDLRLHTYTQQKEALSAAGCLNTYINNHCPYCEAPKRAHYSNAPRFWMFELVGYKAVHNLCRVVRGRWERYKRWVRAGRGRSQDLLQPFNLVAFAASAFTSSWKEQLFTDNQYLQERIFQNNQLYCMHLSVNVKKQFDRLG
jgi:hypothetical protein